MSVEDLGFLVPLVALSCAMAYCAAAALRSPDRRAMWLALSGGAALTVVGAAAGIVLDVGGADNRIAFYIGSGATACLIAGALMLALRALAHATFEALSEGLILGVVVAAVSVYFVVVPGVADGNLLLTAVFLGDVGALLMAGLAGLAGASTEQRRVGLFLTGACAAAAAGDALVSLGVHGHVTELPAVTAVLWAVAGAGLIAAARAETGGDSPPAGDAGARNPQLWLTTRILLPMAAMLALPAVVLLIWAAGGLDGWTVAFFGSSFGVIVLLVFGRQAYLLVDNGRAIARERRLHRDVTRRNADLKALTGLATTMSETLEEAPIVERGLGVLTLAARATSAGVHLDGETEPRLAAATGAWEQEHILASPTGAGDGEPYVSTNGGRHVFWLPLRARGNEIGAVTLLRGEADPFDCEEVERLALLSNQLAIAIQNARDYRDKLEQAIRDPLTGIHNRRYFYEALENEVSRSGRYGSKVSLVIFDIDDFKSVNDSFGHTAGDEVLRRITEIVRALIRPTDSFARLGGEEFGLILPETAQLDALLVADRVRVAVARHRVVEGRRVTLSAGLASCPKDAGGADELEKRADSALLWAKRNGKNICAVASDVTAVTGEEEHDATLSNLYALVSTIDSEPMHTRDHSENVAAYAVALGQELGLPEERIASLRKAAFFHDIGKIAVSRDILGKPSALDDEEWIEMKTHPAVGRSMLRHAGLEQEAVWVGQHHERVDGCGYPEGLKGDEIAEEARIIFVADAFEAMTSDRPYRKGMEVGAAMDELRSCAGTQFDARMVDALGALVEEDRLQVLALRA